jgi:hypothetical protein
MPASRSVMLRSRPLARVLCVALVGACSIYDMPAPRGDLTGSGGGGGSSTGGDGGSGVDGGSGAGGAGARAGNGGDASGGAGGAGNGGGSAGVGGSAGSSGGGGKLDDGGSPAGSGGGPPDGSDAGSSGGIGGGDSGGEGGFSGGADGGSTGTTDGGMSDGAADSMDAHQDRDGQATADADVDPCVAESNAAFCSRVAKNCGTVNGVNNCGAAIAVACGSCMTPQTCGGAGQPNVCGSPTNVAKGGTVSASSPGVSPEDMTKAFDENSATKWYAGDNVNTGWIAYQFASGVMRTVTSYSITSANDMPTRDPVTWQLQGSNDGQNWTVVDSRTGESFASRFLTKSYPCATPMDYGRYRLNVTANAGANALQLAELVLLGY